MVFTREDWIFSTGDRVPVPAGRGVRKRHGHIAHVGLALEIIQHLHELRARRHGVGREDRVAHAGHETVPHAVFDAGVGPAVGVKIGEAIHRIGHIDGRAPQLRAHEGVGRADDHPALLVIRGEGAQAVVERIAEAVARERVERELPVLGRDGVQTEAARGGRELVEADDEILHVLQLRDAHEHLVELLHGVGQLVADAGVEVADLLIDVHEARDVVRLHEVGQLGEQAVEPAQAAERGHAVGRGVSAVVDALAQRVMLRVRE